MIVMFSAAPTFFMLPRVRARRGGRAVEIDVSQVAAELGKIARVIVPQAWLAVPKVCRN